MKLSLFLASQLLALPMLTWGSSFSGTLIKGDISNSLCPVSLPFQQSGTGPLHSGTIDTGTCSFAAGGVTISGEASGGAAANPFGTGPFDVSTGAITNGLDGHAHTEADSFDTITLISPQINYTGGVTVIAGTSYDLTVAGANSGLQAASASISFQIGDIDGNPLMFGPNAQHKLTSDGLAVKGQISDQFTILACPCSFSFRITAMSDASNGAAAGASDDPFFVQLPPGWTYKLASQAATVPEPTSLTLTLIGLIALVPCRGLMRK